MKYKGLNFKDIGNALALGVVIGLIFAIIFNNDNLDKLVYEIFNMPTPGAEIALFIGPAAILGAVFAHYLSRRSGVTFFAIGGFALVTIPAQMLYNPEGFGAIPLWYTVPGFLILMVFLDPILFLFSGRDIVQKYAAPAVLANIAFLLFFWLVAFPIEFDRWPVAEQVDVIGVNSFLQLVFPTITILGAAIVGALVIGALDTIVYATLKEKVVKKTA